MAAEDIGSLYPTKIPGYSDAADIQAALRLYHYGDTTYDISNTNPENLEPNSVAGSFKTLSDRVTDVENAGIPVSVSETEPTSPVDGFIWVNPAVSVVTGGVFGNVIDYSVNAPVTYVVEGRLWAKKGTSPVELYVYNGTTSEWDRIG
jgi:hypothetical protein